MLSRTDPTGHTVAYSHDEAGHLAGWSGGYRVHRDAAGRVRRLVEGDGRVTEYRRDRCGRPVHRSGWADLAWTWDADGRRDSVTLPTAAPPATGTTPWAG